MVVKLFLSVRPGILQLQTFARQAGTLVREAEKVSASVLLNLEFQRNFSKAGGTVENKSVLAVKRPLSPYFLYLKDNFARVKAHAGKNTERRELSKQVRNGWSSLNPQQKQAYSSKAQLLVKEFEQKQIAADKLRQKLKAFVKPSLTPYFLFVKNNFATAPGSRPVEKISKLAIQWKELGRLEKSKYQTKAKLLAGEHKAKLRQLNGKETKALGELKVEKRLAKLKRLGRRTRTQQKAELVLKHKRPQQPLTAYLLYKTTIESQLKGTPVEKAKLAGQRWNQLSDVQKKSFLDRARAANENYQKGLAVWEKEMIAKGLKDVVAKFHTRNDLKFLPEGTRIPGIKKHRRPAKKAGLKKKASVLREKAAKGKKKPTPKVGKKAKKVLSGLATKAKVASKKAVKKIGSFAGDVKKKVAKTADKVVKTATIGKK